MVENTTAQHSAAIRKTHLTLDTQSRKLREVNRHLEDLDNRGMRHNGRLKSLTESIKQEHLQAEVNSIFNALLEKPKEVPIVVERIHRTKRKSG